MSKDAQEFSHQKTNKVTVILVNLGTPAAPTKKALRPYLREFLSDPRVVEIPRFIWWWILNGLIIPFRAKKSAAKYAMIWNSDGSPLLVHTNKQALLLRGYLGERGHQVEVVPAMRYGEPSIPSILAQIQREGGDKIIILPAYPQYSATTTASIYDAVFKHYKNVRHIPELRLVKHYHDHPGYINALKNSVQKHWNENRRGGHLVISFHGVPKRTLLLGDPYHCECMKTARLLALSLGLGSDHYTVAFQSRFGKAEWLKPYTKDTIEDLARNGVSRVDVICPGFIADCLETLEEINIELRKSFMLAGGSEFNYIPCLNEDASWLRAMAEIVEPQLHDWPTSFEELRTEKNNADLRSRLAKQLGAPQ